MQPQHPADMSPPVDLVERRTPVGAVRATRPVYVDLMPPCNDACPAGENIQAWLAEAQAGHFRQAWEQLVRDNPFPAIHGRVCYHPCENACNRGLLDSSVSIHAVERFLGDQARAQGWPLPREADTGKRVLVVGGGPGGLSAAYHLARRGHAVEVREAGPVAGGMLHFGIPAYRLPREVLREEVARLEAIGVKITLNHKVEDVLAEQHEGGFDAVFIAIGAQVGKHIDIPARDASHVLDALALLRQTDAGAPPPLLGRRVVVYGGGNTAMDAARTARRLGAADTLIVYHRDRAHMPAHAFEADEALAEGVKIRWLSSIRQLDGTAMKVEKMVLDANGRPQPTGEFETLPADAVILALGQNTDVDFLRQVPGIVISDDGSIEVGEDMQTGHSGIFAGGDVTPGQRTVTVATGQGKHAARHIDAWLRDQAPTPTPRPRVIGFTDLHLPLYNDALASTQAQLPVAARSGFDEVVSGLDPAQARYEAQRCLSCGNCYECDNCYAACPEEAIVKLGPGRRYRVNLDQCTGCAVCFEQCPCHAIDMVPEPAATEVAP